MDERVKARVDALVAFTAPPLDRDDIGTAVHAVGVAFLEMGGATQVANAAAVITGVTDTWGRRPPVDVILKVATWVTRQDPESPLRRAAAIIEGRNTDPLRDRIEAAICGKMQSLEWPWSSIGSLTRSLMPGGITIIVGNPGTSKSFALLQAVLHWQKAGIRTSLLELEEDHGFWLNRALAIVSGHGCATDPAWIARYPDEARSLLSQHKEHLQTLAENMTVAPPAGMSLSGLAEWIEKQCQDGVRIICCDPVTAASAGNDKPWLAAEVFMLRAKTAIVKSMASLVMTTHPRKGGAAAAAKVAPDQDAMAGGAAFGRFASTILWLEGSSLEETVKIVDGDGRVSWSAINRKIRILKSREGRGAGMVLGFMFDGITMTLNEVGILSEKPAQEKRAKKAVARRKLDDPQRDADAEASADWMTR